MASVTSLHGVRPEPREVHRKRAIYFGSSAAQFERLVKSFGDVPGCEKLPNEGSVIRHGELCCEWVPRLDVESLLDELHTRYVNLVVLDLRGPVEQLRDRAAFAFRILESLDQVGEIEERYAFHRILVLVSGSEAPVDEVVLKLGAHGVRQVLREAEFPASDASEVAFAERVSAAACAMMGERKQGKTALCAAGGGLTGIFFELGALKCIDDCLPGGGVNAFDMFFGISAGAVVNSLVACGYSVDEFMAAIVGVPGGRIAPLDLRVMRLAHVNYQDLLERVGRAARLAWSGLVGRLGRGLSRRETSLFELADLLTPPFSSDGFERMLRTILTAPGACNDFTRLPKPLFVGATDQDARSHVIFGTAGFDEVPISLAVQASMSINPAFSPTYIGGRYYEDGAVTRTSNFGEAIKRGATLILVVDPFVPYVAREAGFAGQRGLLYNIDQNVRTISFTRYETTRDVVLRRYPEVSAYTFLPANRLRRLMAVNPMDHRPYLEIWRGAYLSTLGRLTRLKHRIAGDLKHHGLRLDTAKAEAVAEQLERADRPQFADFFPDRKVALRLPPLVHEPRAPAADAESSVA
ncbi:MAG TPA: patatin-like phospholipase family protein [Myxococcales bacterium]